MVKTVQAKNPFIEEGGRFKCAKCGKLFNKKKDVQDHVRKICDKIYKCNNCNSNKEFNKSGLKYHKENLC